MASPLAGSLSKQLAKGFKGRLLSGTVRRYTFTRDTKGNPEPTGKTDYTFASGIREDFDARWRTQAGIPDTDVGILILLGSISITPGQNDDIMFNSGPYAGAWYHVRQVLSIDPAGASVRLQAYQIAEPAL